MKNIFKTAIIFIFLISFTVKTVNAAVLDSKTIVNSVKKDVTNKISTIVKGKVVTEITEIPYKTVEVPNGNVEINTDVNLRFFSPFTIARVSISVNGETVKTFGVPVKLYVFDKVWVAKDSINYGSSLTENNISLESKEVGLIGDNAARQDFIPYNVKTKRSYKSGDIIDTRYISQIPTVIRSSIVSIVFESQNFTLSLSGEALENGKMGDFIKVRNKQYKKDYIGKVIGTNKVLVSI